MSSTQRLTQSSNTTTCTRLKHPLIQIPKKIFSFRKLQIVETKFISQVETIGDAYMVASGICNQTVQWSEFLKYLLSKCVGDPAWYNPFDRNTSEKRGLSRERDRKNVSETDGDCQGDNDGNGDGDGDGDCDGDGDGDGDGPYTMVITLELLCVKAERKVGGREKWHRA